VRSEGTSAPESGRELRILPAPPPRNKWKPGGGPTILGSMSAGGSNQVFLIALCGMCSIDEGIERLRRRHEPENDTWQFVEPGLQD